MLNNKRNSVIIVFAIDKLVTETPETINVGTFEAGSDFWTNPCYFPVFRLKKKRAYFSFWKKKLPITTEDFSKFQKQKIGQKFKILHGAPGKSISDFETGLIPAVQTEFLNAIYWGCQFHLSKRFSAESKIRAFKYLTEETKIWKFCPKKYVCGIATDKENQNAIEDLVDEERTPPIFYNTRNYEILCII